MLIIYADHLCWELFMLGVIYAECHNYALDAERRYAKCP